MKLSSQCCKSRTSLFPGHRLPTLSLIPPYVNRSL